MRTKVGARFIAVSIVLHMAVLLALSQMTADSKGATKNVVQVRLVEMPKPQKVERPEKAEVAGPYSTKAEKNVIPSEQPGGSQDKIASPPEGETLEKYRPEPAAQEPVRREPEKTPWLTAGGPARQEPTEAPKLEAPPPKTEPEPPALEVRPEPSRVARAVTGAEETIAPAPSKTIEKPLKPRKKAAAKQPAPPVKEKPPRTAPPAQDKGDLRKGFKPESPPPDEVAKAPELIIEAEPQPDSAGGAADSPAREAARENSGGRSVAFLRDDAEGKAGRGGSSPTPERKIVGLPSLSDDMLERYSSLGPGLGDPDQETVSLNTFDFKYFSYLMHVKENIKNSWRYPSEAASRGLEGRLVVRFTIARDGSLDGLHLVSSSGYSILDDEAMRAVKDSSPFYPLPSKWGKERLNINAVFTYRSNSNVFWMR